MEGTASINGEMGRKASVEVGDKVHITLELDTKPRTPPIPKEFADALQRNEQARVAFEKLSPSHQKEVLAYLNYLKRPETLREISRRR